MQCPRCQHENAAGQKSCGECGARPGAVCSSCGTPNPPGQEFCGDCGTAPGQPEVSARYGAPQSYPKRSLPRRAPSKPSASKSRSFSLTSRARWSCSPIRDPRRRVDPGSRPRAHDGGRPPVRVTHVSTTPLTKGLPAAHPVPLRPTSACATSSVIRSRRFRRASGRTPKRSCPTFRTTPTCPP